MNDLINRRLASLGTVSNEIYNEQTLEFISNITSLSNTVFDLASFTVFDLASLSNISKIYPIVEEESHDIQAEKDDHEMVQELFDAFIKECKKESGSRMHEIFSNLNAILDENDESELSIDVSCLFDDVSQSKRMVSANVLKVLSDDIFPLPQLNSPRSVDEQIKETVSGPELIDLLREKVKDTLHEESLIQFMMEKGTQSTYYIMSLYFTLESIRNEKQITEDDIQTIRLMVFELDMYTRMIQNENHKAEFTQNHSDLNAILLYPSSYFLEESPLPKSEIREKIDTYPKKLIYMLKKFLENTNVEVLASIDNAGPDPSKINSGNCGWDSDSDTDNIDHPSPRSRLSI